MYKTLYRACADGEECFIGLSWPAASDTMSDDVTGHIYTLSLEDDFDQASCTLQLNLLHTLRNFIRNNTHCPWTFQWKGILYYTNFTLQELIIL
jgi:hypothetical protein